MEKLLLALISILLPITLMAQGAGGEIHRPVRANTNSNTQQSRPVNNRSSRTNNATNTQPSIRSREVILQDLIKNMILVEGGSFQMGATTEQGSDADSDEKPAHQVTVSSFSIGKYEVTQEEWEVVMGTNPSYEKGSRKPVTHVSWNDCQSFINKLNSLTNRYFRLPTEAEWEFAARGGNRSKGYKYAGSNSIDNVAWYDSARTIHEVGKKSPNELGLYDMSGNVREWCSDWYDGGYYKSLSSLNPQGPDTGSSHVHRGGACDSGAWFCRVSDRNSDLSHVVGSNLGFRLVLDSGNNTSLQQISVIQNSDYANYRKQKEQEEKLAQAKRARIIQNIINNMVRVEGGTFMMGATKEQKDESFRDEKPAHKVTVSTFSICKYEVTQEEWETIMENNPSHFKGFNKPVEMVSWGDCQRFVEKLNKLSGMNFRLPTEAEWEFAARGGNYNKGNKYSGSNIVDNVAWYDINSNVTTHVVGSKAPNELGLYDMSGNVGEWCQDLYGNYSKQPQTNPTGSSYGTTYVHRVYRGGSWTVPALFSRVAKRNHDSSINYYYTIGLRLAM